MGLDETVESHPVLGNIKQALETLVQQRYLQKGKPSGPKGNTSGYEQAERALDGPVTDRIKDHVSKIVKKDVAAVEYTREWSCVIYLAGSRLCMAIIDVVNIRSCKTGSYV